MFSIACSRLNFNFIFAPSTSIPMNAISVQRYIAELVLSKHSSTMYVLRIHFKCCCHKMFVIFLVSGMYLLELNWFYFILFYWKEWNGIRMSFYGNHLSGIEHIQSLKIQKGKKIIQKLEWGFSAWMSTIRSDGNCNRLVANYKLGYFENGIENQWLRISMNSYVKTAHRRIVGQCQFDVGIYLLFFV